MVALITELPSIGRWSSDKLILERLEHDVFPGGFFSFFLGSVSYRTVLMHLILSSLVMSHGRKMLRYPLELLPGTPDMSF